MIKGLTRSWPVSFLVRHVLDRITEYADAVEALQASPLMAPTYIIVAGMHPGEGCVLTRSRDPAVVLPVKSLSEGPPLLQLNMDHFRIEQLDKCG